MKSMTKEYYVPKVGKCGFANIGNTCYMNSILQLLMHCKPLVSFLIKKKVIDETTGELVYKSEYEEYLHTVAKNKVAEIERKRLNIDKDQVVNIKMADVEEFKSGSITAQLAKIVNTCIDKGASVIKPNTFKFTVDRKISAFRGYSQHDAHEYIIHILDAIIEETGIQALPTINNVPDTLKIFSNKILELKEKLNSSRDLEEKKKIIEHMNNIKTQNKQLLIKYEGLNFMMEMYKKQYNPFIYQIQTILVNSVQCRKCNNVTSNYENTPVLELYVEDTLEESLNKLVKNEYIQNYKCSHCGDNQEIKKMCKIWRTPKVLFIQLKRFEVLQNGRIRKNNTSVDIPVELDLEPYCEQIYDPIRKPLQKYSLKGYSNHMGGLDGGHYTADCLCIVDNETWYHFDDSNVTRNINNRINTKNAYILMYVLDEEPRNS